MNIRCMMLLSIIGGFLLPISAFEVSFIEASSMRLALNALTDRALKHGVSVPVWARVVHELGEHPTSLNLDGLHLTVDQFNCLAEVLLSSMKDVIVKISLARNQLGRLPESLKKFRHVRILNVSSNQLVSLPSWLSRLIRLEELNASDNLLREIPEGIMGNWKRARVLNFAGNQLYCLPSDLWSIDGVQELNVSFNKLSMLSDSIASWSALRELYIFGNRGIIVPQFISCLSHLCVLHIDEDVRLLIVKKDLQIERIAVRDR